jgi:hypothetical protein
MKKWSSGSNAAEKLSTMREEQYYQCLHDGILGYLTVSVKRWGERAGCLFKE